MKKMFKMISLTLAALMAAAAFTACGAAPVNVTGEESSDGALTYISMRINPEIEVVADEDGEIIAANAIDEDGEVVLAEVDLIGQTVAEAGETFTEVATELGYLDADSPEATVYIDAEGESEELSKKFEHEISDRIHKFFDNNGIFGKVSPETLERYAEQADAWGLPGGQVKMVLRLLDLYPEMTEEEALAMTPAERMAMIKDSGKKNEKISVGLREEMKAEVGTIKEKYAATFALKEEIRELRRSLEDETLSEDAKATIRAQIDEKQAVYDEQIRAYREEVKALRENYREQTEKTEKEVKQKADQKREENADKLRKHKKAFEEDREGTREKIREWRGKQKHVTDADPEPDTTHQDETEDAEPTSETLPDGGDDKGSREKKDKEKPSETTPAV